MRGETKALLVGAGAVYILTSGLADFLLRSSAAVAAYLVVKGTTEGDLVEALEALEVELSELPDGPRKAALSRIGATFRRDMGAARLSALAVAAGAFADPLVVGGVLVLYLVVRNRVKSRMVDRHAASELEFQLGLRTAEVRSRLEGLRRPVYP